MLKILLYLISISYADLNFLHEEFTQDNRETITQIALRASHLNSKLTYGESLTLGYLITKKALEANLEPLTVAALIATESDFRQEATNPSGDFSIAQINYPVWQVEFVRLGREGLDLNRLMNDVEYSLDRMMEILVILRERHPNDKQFYGRYHSGTKSLKIGYLERVYRHRSMF